MKYILLLILAFGNLALTPVRASYEDVGLGVLEHYDSTPWKFAIDGHTLNQTERDARESFLIGRVLPEVIGFAESIHCDSAVDFADNQFGAPENGIMLLEWDYRGREDEANGWDLKAVDRHYGKEKAILQRIRNCVLNKKAACAASPSLTPGILTALALVKVSDLCQHAPAMTFAEPVLNTSLFNVGHVRTTQQPATSSATNAALDAADAAHATASSGGSADVFLAHFQLESTARNTNEQHRFRALDFHGMIGTGWSMAEVAVIRRMQHHFYHEAIVCTKQGDWGCSDMRWADHQKAHLCMNLPKRFTYTFAFAVRDAAGVFTAPGTWPTKTCAQWVEVFS